MDAPDPRVDHYIDALPAWQQEICRQLRELIHAADPEITETIKRRVQPYFVLQGNVCALLAASDHVNLFLYDGAIVPDPEQIITGGHDNQTARTVDHDAAPDRRQQPRRRLAPAQAPALVRAANRSYRGRDRTPPRLADLRIPVWVSATAVRALVAAEGRSVLTVVEEPARASRRTPHSPTVKTGAPERI